MRATFEPIVVQRDDGERTAARLGSLDVPARRDVPGSAHQRLRWIHLDARTDAPGPPTIWLAGGPGESGTEHARFAAWGYPQLFEELRALGDVIVWDQRGTGLSGPVPAALRRWDLPLDRPLTPDAYLKAALARCAEMRADWTDRGVEVGGYTAVESADDLAALADALGAEAIRLVGFSYGSHLGLTMLRRHPERVDRAYLGNVEGPDDTLKLPSRVQSAMETIAELARADHRVLNEVGDLLALTRGLVAQLTEQPATVVTSSGPVVVGGYDLQRFICGALGDQDLIASMPRSLRRFAGGDLGELAIDALESRRAWPASATFWHTDAASGASAGRRARIAAEASHSLLGDVINHPFPAVEQAWGSPDLGDAFRLPLESDLPVQFQSGSLDGRTPEANAEDLLVGLHQSGHTVVEGVAHDEVLWDRRVREGIARFLGGADPKSERIKVPFAFANLP